MFVQSIYMKCITNLILDLARQFWDSPWKIRTISYISQTLYRVSQRKMQNQTEGSKSNIPCCALRCDSVNCSQSTNFLWSTANSFMVELITVKFTVQLWNSQFNCELLSSTVKVHTEYLFSWAGPLSFWGQSLTTPIEFVWLDSQILCLGWSIAHGQR
jgi:hypothetical protein